MRRRILTAALAVTAVLLTACNDKPLPTAPIVNGPAALGSINSSGLCVDAALILVPTDAEVQRLITGLFADANHEASTLSMWEGIKRDKLESRPLQNHIDNLAKWVLEKFGANTLQDPDGNGNEIVDYNVTTGTFTLLDLVFRCAGETPTDLPPVPEGFHAAWAVVNEGIQEEVTTDGAKGFLPGDALQGSAVLALVFQDDRVNTPFPKWSPTVDVQLVGNGKLKLGKKLSLKLCPKEVTSMDYDRLVIAHQRKPVEEGDEVGKNVEYLPPAEAGGSTLDCHDDVGASMWRMEKGFLRQRAAQFAFFAKKAARFVSPRVLYAGHAAIGGSFEGGDDGRGFSPTVIVDPYVQTSITDVNIPTTVYGTPVVITANLRVSGVGVPGDCPALPAPRPAACDWIGEPITQDLEGMPQLITPLMITATVDDEMTTTNQVKTEQVQPDGSVRFEFSNVNAGDDHNAALAFPRTRNRLPALVGSAAVAFVPDFDASSSPTNRFEVQPAPLSITPANASRTYGDVTIDSELTGEVEGEVYDEDGDIIVAYTTDATQESYITTATRAYKTMVATVTPQNGVLLSNYDITSEEGVFTINQRTLTGAATANNRLYGDANPALTGNVANLVSGFNDGITVLWENSSVAATPAGPPGPAGTDANLYLIKARLVDDPAVEGNPLENYTDPHAITAATLTINPRPLRVAVVSESRVYGEPNPLFRHFASNAVNDDAFNVTFNTSADAGTDVGTYAVTVGSVTPTSGGPLHNYTVVNTNAGQLTITPRPLTVTPEAKVVTYGDEITLTGNVVGAYAPDLGTRLVIGYTTTPEHNGQASETPYTINSHATGAAIDAGNYATDLRTATLTINRAPLDIFADHYTRQVGEDNPAFTGTITEGQVKNNDVIEVTGSTTANASSPAGTYAIIPDAVGERIANYFIRSRTNGVLTVEAPASSVVTGLIGVSSTEALVGTVRINAGSLFSIDAATGTATVIGAHGILGCLGPKTSAVAVDPLTGQLYGMIGGSAGGSKLIRIDRTSGTGTVVGDLVGPGFNGAACQGGSDALTFSSDGTLYASGWFGGTISGGSLLRVNKATGAVLSAQRTTGGIFFAGLVFAADGTLWASRGGNGPGLIHTIDPATGQTITTIQLRTASGANDFARVSDLAFDSEGTLWASLPQENMLATINTTTGIITRVGSFGPNTTRMSGLAFAP